MTPISRQEEALRETTSRLGTRSFGREVRAA
jgi:hypothetical protein